MRSCVQNSGLETGFLLVLTWHIVLKSNIYGGILIKQKMSIWICGVVAGVH